MPLARISKAVVVAAVALLLSLVAFGNLTDYETNFIFVQHVLTMDTTFPTASIRYRAIHSSILHHVAYWFIIATELAIAALCWIGSLRLVQHRHDSISVFNEAKGLAIAGLTLGVVLWLAGFMAIGGEWFGMWMSPTWNAIPSAFRFLITTLGALIYLSLPDEGVREDGSGPVRTR